MPLLHKRKVSLPSAQPPYRSTEEYWVHRVTREVFTNYKDYIERVELYRQPIWTCEYSGKSGMTYEEALLSEQHCMQLASALPKHYYQEAFRVIHQNTEGLTGLVDTLSKHLKQTFVTGERVMLKREGRLVTILKRMSTNKKTALYEVTTEENPTEYENGANEKEKEKEKEEREEEAKEDKMEEEKGEYDPLLNPRNNKKSTASQAEEQTEKKEKTRFQVLHKELVKPQAVLSKITKPILKQFIRTVANKEPYVGAPWLIREDMFDYDEYHLTKDLPPHIVTLREKYLRKVRKRGSTEMEDAESEEGASEEENSENGHGNGDHDPLLTPSKKQKKKKNAPPSYPMEDTLLPDALSRQPPVAIPLPEYFPDLLMLFFFFYTFGRPLRLSPFSLDELEKALQSSLKQNLIDEIMISLLRTINQDKGGVAVKPRGITHSSWPSILQRTLKQIASRRSFADVAEKEEEEEGEEEEGESEQEEEEEEDGESTKWKKQPNLQNGAKKAKTKTEQNKKNDEEEEESSEEEEEEEKVEVESSEEDGENSFKTTMSVLSNAGFTLLSMSEKLEILCLLCHAALDSSAIRECMNESLLNAKDILNEDQEIKENAKPENGVKGNAIERMIAKVRYTALGMDRHYNRYWQWRGQKMNIGQPRVYVEFPPSSTSSGDTSATSSSPKSSVEKSTWGYYDTPEQVEQLLSFLDERGNREQKLKANLLKKRSKIEDDMKGKASRFSHQHLLAMGEVRRSSRLQRQQHPSDGSMSSASSSSSALLGSSTQYVNLYRQQK